MDRFTRAAAAGTSTRRPTRLCPLGRLSVRLEVEAGVGGSGPAGGLLLDAGGARDRGGFDGHCAAGGARAPESRGERVNAIPSGGRYGRGGRSGGPCSASTHRPPPVPPQRDRVRHSTAALPSPIKCGTVTHLRRAGAGQRV